MSKLLDQVRDVLRTRHYSYRTEKTYIQWILQYIRFHDVTHPMEMGAAEVEAFLTHFAVERNVAASTQIYTHVLKNKSFVKSPLDD